MPNNTKWTLILASASPRRKELLSYLGAPFQVQVAGTDEASFAIEPMNFCLEIAQQKALAVRERVRSDKTVVVASDTVVSLGQKIFGKPRDKQEANQFLRELSGRTHLVHTAVVIHIFCQHAWQVLSHVEATEVEFSIPSEGWLKDYIASGDSLDKAGAYGIQGPAVAMVKSVRGCYANVVGFPLVSFDQLMTDFFNKTEGSDKPWQSYFSF